jgi:hypothetical protein
MAETLISMRFVLARRGRRVRRRLAALFAGAAMAALTVALAGTAMAADAGPGAQAVAPLRITDVSPESGSLGVPMDTTIFVDFDTRMDTDTVFRDIKLKKKGARKAVCVTDVYMFADDTWTGFPHEALQPDTVYQVIVEGGRDGVRGENGSKLGGVDDPSARFRDGDVVWSFRTAG